MGTGSVLVVGSDNICSPGAAWDESVTTEVGDPQAGEWEKTASLPRPRDRFLLAALPDGRALVAGGTTSEGKIGPQSFSSTYLFDPGTSAWSRSGPLNTARSDPAGAVLTDGRVLIAGGYYADLPAHPPMRMLDSSELFDPAAGTWSRTGSLVDARYSASAVTLADGRVLVVGGWPSVKHGPAPLYGPQQPPLASAEIFDPKEGRWERSGNLKSARTGFALVALGDGGALVAGGLEPLDFGDFGTGWAPLRSAERFDPRTGVWSRTDDMAVAAAGRTAIRLTDGRVLMAGGDITFNEPDLDETPPALTGDAEIYDPAAGVWHATIPMPRPRSGASAVLLDDGSVLLAGGDKAVGRPDQAPSCPVPDPQVLRYVPGS